MFFKRSNLLVGHAASVYGIAHGSRNDTIFSAGGDKFAVEWNTTTGEQDSLAVKFENPVFTVSFITGQNLLVAGTAVGGLHIIDIASKQEQHHFTTHRKGIYDLHYIKERKQLFVAGGDGVLSVWSIPDFQLLRKIPLSSEKLRQIAVSDDHGLIAIACSDGTIRLLEPDFFSEIRSINAHTQGATSVAWHPTKPVLMSGGRDAMLKCWNSREQYECVLSLPAHNFAIYSIVFNSTRQLIATASRDKTIKIWDANTLDNLQRLDVKDGGHTHSVNKLIWKDDVLISCGDDRKIITWQHE